MNKVFQKPKIQCNLQDYIYTLFDVNCGKGEKKFSFLKVKFDTTSDTTEPVSGFVWIREIEEKHRFYII